MKLNKSAAKIAMEMIEKSKELRINIHKLKNGATILDCGIKSKGGLEAGRLYSSVCLGGLAKVSISKENFGEIKLPTVKVETDEPWKACIGSQKAGWNVKIEEYLGMGSGPARMLLNSADERYKEDSDIGVLALENSKLPNEKVSGHIAKKCGVDEDKLILLTARTASLVGSTQVSARMVETALYKMNYLGMDFEVSKASGFAPIAMVIGDDKRMMGIENDMIIYGATVHLEVEGDLDIKAIPSISSPDYGEPFSEVFKKAGYDFYKIDPGIFAPAMVTVKDLMTGRIKNAGYINSLMIEKTLTTSG
jgi:methenyltetrahydromethanopterin cyclohydrolase